MIAPEKPLVIGNVYQYNIISTVSQYQIVAIGKMRDGIPCVVYQTDEGQIRVKPEQEFRANFSEVTL